MTPRPSALIRNRAAVTLFALALTICTATIAACTPPPAASAPPGPPSAATIASVFQSMHTPGRASFDSAVAKFPITPAKVNEIAESTREQTRFRGMIEDSPSLIIGN